MFPKTPLSGYTDKGEPKHGASIAINWFLTHLTQAAKTDQYPTFNLMLVNMWTLVRNCYSASATDLVAGIIQELNMLSTYLDGYLSAQHVRDGYSLPVLVYVPTYRHLPIPLQREMSAEMKRVSAMMPVVIRKIDEISEAVRTGRYAHILFVKVGSSKHYPHQELGRELIRLSKDKGFGYNYGDPYLMLSHIQLDWHVVRELPKISLVESYTGRFVKEDMLGSKLIGLKDTKVPFNSALHRVFGDNTLVNGLVIRQKKKAMLEAANKWAVMPTHAVLQQMASIAGVTIGEITSPSF